MTLTLDEHEVQGRVIALQDLIGDLLLSDQAPIQELPHVRWGRSILTFGSLAPSIASVCSI